MSYLVFQLTETAGAAQADERAPRRLPSGYTFEIWRPGWRSILPPTLGAKFSAWWALDLFGRFRNHDYAVLIVRRNGRAVHRTCLIPKYFRWPFMKDGDLQVSSIWTAEEHRCLGLAAYAVEQAVEIFCKPGRTFWYVTHPDNLPSLSLCRGVGFDLHCVARRTSRFNLRILGQLIPLEGSERRQRSVSSDSFAAAVPGYAPGYKASSASADSGAK
jgi:hypothetical protein